MVTTYDIDCGLLMSAMNYFSSIGYTPLSSPMLVDKDSIETTFPIRYVNKHLDKYYVGSAEQSFYQLMNDGMKPDGSYMLIAPCERYERLLDMYHLNVFLKLELISTVKNFASIMLDVADFLDSQGIKNKVLHTETGYDILVNGIEVGSYGCRNFGGIDIHYGTGLAMPRITQAVSN